MPRPSSYPVHPRQLVLSVLRTRRVPMTAYELLAVLKPQGIKAPPVIYRALDALMKEGAIHKIKELGAFVACDCTQGHHHALSVITVCQECHAVVELHDHGVMHQLESLRDQGIRLSPRAVIELPVTCDACAA